MKKLCSCIAVLALCMCGQLSAQESTSSGIYRPFALQVSPFASIPLGENDELINFGGGGHLVLEYAFPGRVAITLGASTGYSYAPTDSFGTFSILSAGARVGAVARLFPWLHAHGAVSGGYYYAANFAELTYVDYLYGAVDMGLSFILGTWFSIAVGAEYRWDIGFGGSIRPFAGIGVLLGGEKQARIDRTPVEKVPSPASPKPLAQEPVSGDGLQIRGVNLQKVFPVFFSYYNENPVGTIAISNPTGISCTDIKVSFFVNTYMDVPKSSNELPEIKPGESAQIDLHALFNDTILEVTEGKQVAATLTVDYKMNGEPVSQDFNDTLEILYRNAHIWDDDRRAAVFVTAKDPVVLSFARNIKSIVQNAGAGAVDSNLRLAIAVHEALSRYGITYTPDPQNSFSEQRDSLDFLQFPRETLEYRSGDCDDLSILYCALFEALSIETAFITIPGHIYMAVGLSMTEDEARKWFSRPDELILQDGKAWLPIEITERDNGFQQAWLTGAKEWRENYSRGQTGFFPVRNAWDSYAPVQLPGSFSTVALPQAELIVSSFEKQLNWFLNREIAPKVAELELRIKNSERSERFVNRLGVLYARYGIYDKAEEEFLKLLAMQEYPPALINLGHVARLKGEAMAALDYFDRALKVDPNNTKALLASAQMNHELENYGIVGMLYAKLVELDPELADRFRYLDLRGEEATRAADVTRVKGLVIWDDE